MPQQYTYYSPLKPLCPQDITCPGPLTRAASCGASRKESLKWSRFHLLIPFLCSRILHCFNQWVCSSQGEITGMGPADAMYAGGSHCSRVVSFEFCSCNWNTSCVFYALVKGQQK